LRSVDRRKHGNIAAPLCIEDRLAEIARKRRAELGNLTIILGRSSQAISWRREFGGLRTDQVKRIKELETENLRLRKAVSDLTLDKLILEVAREIWTRG